MKNKIDWNILDKTQQVEITPDLAAKLLSKNHSNRPIRQMTVFTYSHQMEKGEWKQNNPQPIIFGMDEYLLDGQHRLSGIIKSGITLSWNVYVIGDKDKLPMDLMVDVGQKRNYADILGLDRNIIASINKLLVNCTYGSGFKPSIKQVFTFYTTYIADDELICDLLKKKIRPLWSNADTKSVALAFYLSDPTIKEYVVGIINSILTKDIGDKQIVQKVLMKVSERTYSKPEITKIVMMLFNPNCADYKIVKLNQDVSIPQFYRKCLDDINFSDYYKDLLPHIKQFRSRERRKNNGGRKRNKGQQS